MSFLQKVSKLIFFISLISVSVAQADDNTFTVKDILLGSAITGGNAHIKQTPETQASKAIASAEVLKLLEILENPEKRQQAIEHLKNRGEIPSKSVSTPNIQDWWTSICQWVKRDNLLIAIKAALKILVILIIYMVFRRLINRFVAYYTQRISILHKDRPNQSTTVAIIKTISPVIQSTVHWVLIILAVLLILSELNINIMPIIYS